MAAQNINTVFATAQKGKDLITNEDDYLKRLSPFDRQSKMQSNKKVTQQDFITFMGQHTLEWSAEERDKVQRGINLFKDLSSDLSLKLPEDTFFVKTTGKEEGGGAYTRANAIFIPQNFLEHPQDTIDWVVCHEFFHVLTRENPALRENLYQLIGFEKCGEVELPADLEALKISNPDAPIYDHVIKVQSDGVDHWGVPVIYSEREFDESEGKTFFDYLTFKLLLTKCEDNKKADIKTAFNTSAYGLQAPKDVRGFFEQIGNNTNYIIHPEEILAENFVHMLMQTKDLKNPEIPDKMRQTIIKHGKALQTTPGNAPSADIG
ncbi:MAG: hypothetical protein CMH27_09200 [Micavibrio sp.]|nr:hypothetical protein [Micavibrio sp.]|tara:strand:+ start:699 stop:1658 length:960 start_codon:yes stop_codon:yes gene_type:complete